MSALLLGVSLKLLSPLVIWLFKNFWFYLYFTKSASWRKMVVPFRNKRAKCSFTSWTRSPLFINCRLSFFLSSLFFFFSKLLWFKSWFCEVWTGIVNKCSLLLFSLWVCRVHLALPKLEPGTPKGKFSSAAILHSEVRHELCQRGTLSATFLQNKCWCIC